MRMDRMHPHILQLGHRLVAGEHDAVVFGQMLGQVGLALAGILVSASLADLVDAGQLLDLGPPGWGVLAVGPEDLVQLVLRLLHESHLEERHTRGEELLARLSLKSTVGCLLGEAHTVHYRRFSRQRIRNVHYTPTHRPGHPTQLIC